MQSNNTSGHRCVFWSKQRNKWKALIRKNGKEHFLGYFVEKSDAANAVKAHIGEIHGDFKGQIRNDNDIIAYRIIPERTTKDTLTDDKREWLIDECKADMQRYTSSSPRYLVAQIALASLEACSSPPERATNQNGEQ